ncbi:MAG TPA: Fe-S protein assembly co-chaperone HscB [Methylophilaceae bacterium]|nr:Fe-S protein assembly co-chaperone HscB [Methylophilaceae bacterium]
MTPDLHQNHFELFSLPVQYAINMEALDQNYRKLQSEVHPDRFAAAPSTDRMRSLQLATLANEAYRTLKNPTARARYLLHINGIDTQEESNTAMPPDFLMMQMEWREAIDDARADGDIKALEMLLKKMQQEAKGLQENLRAALDDNKQLSEAAEAVRKLSFIDKVRGDIEQTIIKLED